MKSAKILLINLIVFLIGFLFLELSLRSFLTFKHYQNPYSNYWGKTWFRYNPVNYISFDEELKFKPTPNTKLKNVDLPRWEKNSNISINNLSFRDNRNDLQKTNDKRILLVGDSITFGSQVTDKNTWSSCLERKVEIKTDNAGVPGYSAGQAVKRGFLESKKRNYSHIIWSIYFRDFRRDISGKILLKENNKILFNKKFEKDTNKKINIFKKTYFILKEYSFVIYYFDIKFLKVKFDKNRVEIDKNINLNEDILVKEFAKYLIEYFKDIQITNKIILLQYLHIQPGDTKDNNPEIYDIEILKDTVVKLANKLDIKVYDTNDVLKKYTNEEKKLLYFDHHTKLGNQMICDFVSKKL